MQKQHTPPSKKMPPAARYVIVPVTNVGTLNRRQMSQTKRKKEREVTAISTTTKVQRPPDHGTVAELARARNWSLAKDLRQHDRLRHSNVGRCGLSVDGRRLALLQQRRLCVVLRLLLLRRRDEVRVHAKRLNFLCFCSEVLSSFSICILQAYIHKS
jgi:hypothetical protein